MKNYTATFSTGETVTRGTRSRTYSHAWAIIAEGKIIRHGFAREERLAHAAAASEANGHREGAEAWKAGTHWQSKTEDAQFRARLDAFYAAPVTAEVVPTVEVK